MKFLLSLKFIGLSLLLSIGLYIFHTPWQSSTLRPFSSDACSLFPEGTWSQPTRWCHCCVQHDLAYWQGGSASQRLAADQSLRSCVQHTGENLIGSWMYAGVRLGGSPYTPTWFRWAYGWPYGKGYQTLTSHEQKEVMKRSLEISIKRITQQVCASTSF